MSHEMAAAIFAHGGSVHPDAATRCEEIAARRVREARVVFLRELAEDNMLLWNVARAAIEEELVDFRDSGLSFPYRGNGLVIKHADGSDSSIIRLGPEMAMATGLRALAEHFEKEGKS